MKVVLVNKDEIQKELALAGWMGAVSTDFDTSSEEALIKVARHCIKSNHGTPTRAMRFVFEISEVSRAFSHEFVRHEIGLAKVQRSQRYVNEDGFGFVTPKGLDNKKVLVNIPNLNIETALSFDQFQDIVKQMYNGFIEQGVKAEDARYALTNATHTKIHVSMDWEGIENFCMRRRCLRAQWEIREVADLVVEEIWKISSFLAERLTAPCDKIGYCTEVKGCGKAPSKEEFLRVYRVGLEKEGLIND